MAIFTFAAPDGKQYDIEAPEGATQDQAFEFLKANWDSISSSAQESAKVEPTAEQPTAQEQEPSMVDRAKAYLQNDENFKSSNPTVEAIRQYAYDKALAASKGIVSVPEAAVGLADIASGGQAGKSLEEQGIDFEAAREYLTSQQSPEEQQAAKEREGETTFLGTLGSMARHPDSALNVALESAAPSLAGGMIGQSVSRIGALGKAAPFVAPAAGEFTIGAGQQAESTRQETPTGLLTPTQAGLAVVAGGADAFFAGVGGVVAKKLGLADFDTLSAGTGSADVANKSVLKAAVGGVFSEGVLEELPQSASEQILQNIALDKPDILEGVSNAAAVGLVTGGLMGGGYSLADIAAQKAQQEAQPTQPTQPTPTVTEQIADTQPIVTPEILKEAEERGTGDAQLDASIADQALQKLGLSANHETVRKLEIQLIAEHIARTRPQTAASTTSDILSAGTLEEALKASDNVVNSAIASHESEMAYASKVAQRFSQTKNVEITDKDYQDAVQLEQQLSAVREELAYKKFQKEFEQSNQQYEKSFLDQVANEELAKKNQQLNDILQIQLEQSVPQTNQIIDNEQWARTRNNRNSVIQMVYDRNVPAENIFPAIKAELKRQGFKDTELSQDDIDSYNLLKAYDQINPIIAKEPVALGGQPVAAKSASDIEFSNTGTNKVDRQGNIIADALGEQGANAGEQFTGGEGQDVVTNFVSPETPVRQVSDALRKVDEWVSNGATYKNGMLIDSKGKKFVLNTVQREYYLNNRSVPIANAPVDMSNQLPSATQRGTDQITGITKEPKPPMVQTPVIIGEASVGMQRGTDQISGVKETPIAETPIAETPIAETPTAETPVVAKPISAKDIKIINTGINDDNMFIEGVYEMGNSASNMKSIRLYETNKGDIEIQISSNTPVKRQGGAKEAWKEDGKRTYLLSEIQNSINPEIVTAIRDSIARSNAEEISSQQPAQTKTNPAAKTGTVENPILKKNGLAFPSQQSAQTYIRTNPDLSKDTHTTIKLDMVKYGADKYGIVTSDQVVKKTSNPVANLNKVQGNEELRVLIQKLGGLSRVEMKERGFTDYKRITRLFNNGVRSRTFDDMATVLRSDYGFDGIQGANDLETALWGSLNGKPYYGYEGIDNAMDKIAADKADQDQQEQDELLNTYTNEELNQILEAETKAAQEKIAADIKAEKRRKADQEIDTLADEMLGRGKTTTMDIFAPERKGTAQVGREVTVEGEQLANSGTKVRELYPNHWFYGNKGAQDKFNDTEIDYEDEYPNLESISLINTDSNIGGFYDQVERAIYQTAQSDRTTLHELGHAIHHQLLNYRKLTENERVILKEMILGDEQANHPYLASDKELVAEFNLYAHLFPVKAKTYAPELYNELVAGRKEVTIKLGSQESKGLTQALKQANVTIEKGYGEEKPAVDEERTAVEKEKYKPKEWTEEERKSQAKFRLNNFEKSRSQVDELLNELGYSLLNKSDDYLLYSRYEGSSKYLIQYILANKNIAPPYGRMLAFDGAGNVVVSKLSYRHVADKIYGRDIAYDMMPKVNDKKVLEKLKNQLDEGSVFPERINIYDLFRKFTSSSLDSIDPLETQEGRIKQIETMLKGRIPSKSNIKFSKAPSQNTHTEQSLKEGLTQAGDNAYGKGWTDKLLATGKFEIISDADAQAIVEEASGSKFALVGDRSAANTQIDTTMGAYAAVARNLFAKIPNLKNILDYGAGKGRGTASVFRALQNKNIDANVKSYEPFPENWAKSLTDEPDYTNADNIKDGSQDAVINLNVLNVVPRAIRDDIVKNIGRILKDGGVAVISSRRWKGDVDTIKPANSTAGEEPNSFYVTRKLKGEIQTNYQKGIEPDELVAYIQDLLPNFDVRKINGYGASAVIIQKPNGTPLLDSILKSEKTQSKGTGSESTSELRKEAKDLGAGERYSAFGVGKKMGDEVYLHKDYEDVLPQGDLADAKERIGNFKYNLIRYNAKMGAIGFFNSPDFDTSPEPVNGELMVVEPDGTIRNVPLNKDLDKQAIYHHKWQWVKDDYTGFDVKQSIERSIEWQKIVNREGINRKRIGFQGVWQNEVLKPFDIKYSKNGEIEAFFNPADGRTYFVAENISKDKDLHYLLMHEVGVHALNMGANKAEFEAILRQVDNLVKVKNPAALKGQEDAIKAGTPQEDLREETLAYLLKYAPKLKIVDKFKAWFKNAVRSLAKYFPQSAQKLGFIKWANTLSDQDLLYIADATLRKAPEAMGAVGERVGGVKSSRILTPTQILELTKNGQLDLMTLFSSNKPAPRENSRIGLAHEEILKRVPELTQSAINMMNILYDNNMLVRGTKGNLVKGVSSKDVENFAKSNLEFKKLAEEHDALVEKYKPVEPYETLPTPATESQMQEAFKAVSKTSKINQPIPDGYKVKLRLDIPAYKNKGVWVVTAHEGNTEKNSIFGVKEDTPIGYYGYAVADNPNFSIEELGALRIADTTRDKYPLATVDGEYVNMSAEKAKQLADEALTDPNWIQVGMDPERHSYFYNRETMQPVVSGDRVIQIGSILMVENPVYAKKSDFLFSKLQPTGNEILIDLKPLTAGQKTIRNFQDEYLRMRQMLNEIKKVGGVVNEENDIVLASEAAINIAANKLAFYKDKLIDPLIEKVAKLNVSLDDIALFMYAKHAPERNAEMQAINPKFRKTGEGGSGMTDKQAADIIKATKNDMGDKFDEFEKLADEWQSIQTLTKNILVSSGDISPETANAYESTYSYHVPLKGFEKIDEATGQVVESRGNVGQGFSISGKFDRRALGRESRAANILENIMLNLERAIIRSSKIHVQRTLAQLIEDNPNLVVTDPRTGKTEKLWEVDVTPMKPTMGKGKAQYNIFYNESYVATYDTLKDARRFIVDESDRDVGKEKNQYKIVKEGGEPQVTLVRKPYDQYEEISYWRNGKQVRINVRDEEFIKAFNRLGDENIYGMFKYFASFNRFMRNAYTTYNPSFIIANGVMVDPMTGLFTNIARQGSKFGATVLLKTPKAAMQLAQYTAKGKASDPEWDAIIKQWLTNGGKSGLAYITGIEQKTEELNRAVERARLNDTRFYQELGAKAKMAIFDNKLINLITFLAEVGENATRLSTFKVAMDKGLSAKKAADLSRNVTINFNRRGTFGREVGSFYLFFNAYAQGLENLADATVHGEHKGQAMAMLTTLASLGYLIALVGGDDGDDDLIPQEEKSRFLTLTLDEKTGLRVDWKMPYGLSFFKDFGTAIYRLQAGAKPDEVGAFLFNSFLSNFSYVNPMVTGEFKKEDLALGVTPTLLKQAIGLAFNRNMFGKPIHPDNEYDKITPMSEREWSTTRGTVYSDVAKWMNSVSGGSKVKSGLIDFSPDSLRQFVSMTTGSAGRDLVDTLNLPVKVYQTVTGQDTNGTELNLKNIPVAKVFIKKDDIDAYRRVFNNENAKLKNIHDRDEQYLKNKSDPNLKKEYTQFKIEYAKELKLYNKTRLIESKIKDLKDDIEEARIADNKGKMKSLEIKQMDVLKKFIAMYNAR